MITKRKTITLAALMLVLAMVTVLAGCSRIGGAIDPRDWGYESQVIYHALGGKINTREVRETYYQNGSLIFEPRGTTNMLIRPVRDGYILAGWYKGPAEPQLDENGQPVIEFKAEDRWDFNMDRVEDSMTLYARWIPQGIVSYVDSMTDKVLFSKNITADSPVQPLTSVTSRLIEKPGYTMEGYFEDKEGTIPYDFSTYVHGELIPAERDVYAQLMEEFPDAIAEYDGEEELPPLEETEGEEVAEEAAEPGEGEATGEEDEEPIVERDPIDPLAYMKRLGYIYTTEDEAVLAEIKARKQQIIEDSIQHYEENTAGKTIWLKYSEGKNFVVRKIDDMLLDGRYGFFGRDSRGITYDKYVIEADLDFSGKTFAMVTDFTGTIEGKGHTLENIAITVASRKMDQGMSFQGGIFGKLSGATIKDLHLKNVSIHANLAPSNHFKAAPLAALADGATVENVTIDGVDFNFGRGDDGVGTYEVSDFIFEPGNSTLDNIEVTNFSAESDHATVRKDFAD